MTLFFTRSRYRPLEQLAAYTVTSVFPINPHRLNLRPFAALISQVRDERELQRADYFATRFGNHQLVMRVSVNFIEGIVVRLRQRIPIILTLTSERVIRQQTNNLGHIATSRATDREVKLLLKGIHPLTPTTDTSTHRPLGVFIIAILGNEMTFEIEVHSEYSIFRTNVFADYHFPNQHDRFKMIV